MNLRRRRFWWAFAAAILVLIIGRVLALLALDHLNATVALTIMGIAGWWAYGTFRAVMYYP